MHFIYLLKGENGRLYVGRTGDLKERMRDHKNGKTWTTKRLGKFELIFYESFKSKKDAIRRERYLKTSKGKKSLKLILRESLR